MWLLIPLTALLLEAAPSQQAHAAPPPGADKVLAAANRVVLTFLTTFDDESRGAYEHLDCDQRPAANEKLWWFATPLFSDSAGDRRSTHFAREVLVQLHSALSWDERYDWRDRFGGESVREMLTRYGCGVVGDPFHA